MLGLVRGIRGLGFRGLGVRVTGVLLGVPGGTTGV